MDSAQNSDTENLGSIPIQFNYFSWKSWILTYKVEESSDLMTWAQWKERHWNLVTFDDSKIVNVVKIGIVTRPRQSSLVTDIIWERHVWRERQGYVTETSFLLIKF